VIAPSRLGSPMVGYGAAMTTTTARDPLSQALDKVDPAPRSLARVHFVCMIAWALLAIPTILIWRDSILWVAFMSLYANFVGHFSGWDAARAEEKADSA
jgi:hypothetical protein